MKWVYFLLLATTLLLTPYDARGTPDEAWDGYDSNDLTKSNNWTANITPSTPGRGFFNGADPTVGSIFINPLTNGSFLVFSSNSGNSYGNGTIINGGTLALTGAGSVSTSSEVIVNNGTFSSTSAAPSRAKG